MNFKINVPSNYQKNSLMDGNDKIDVFVSPDQNLVIRVRSIPLGQQITDTQLQAVFEQNVINGAVRLSDEASDLNGLPARWSGYIWKYENVNTILGNYYIVQENISYVVWAIVPENMVEQKTREMANIMGSFQLINGHPQQNAIAQDPFAGSSSTGQNALNSGNLQTAQTNSQSGSSNVGGNNNFAGTQTSSTVSSSGNKTSVSSSAKPNHGLTISGILFGTGINNNLSVTNPTANLPVSTKQIHAVFKYDGNTNGQNFEIKWFSETHKGLVAEDIYLPKTNGQNAVHASIENAGNPWPKGNYRAEIWCKGYKISGRNFTIGQAPPPPVAKKTVSPPNGTLLGKTFTDGTGDNNTKSKGGKYLPVEIKNLADDDEIRIKITSGTLQFVHIHFRSKTGMWNDAYHGTNTNFKVKDILKGQRNSYTHLIFNVNGQHERYLGTACSAEVWQIPSLVSSPPAPKAQPKAQPKVATTNSSGASFPAGGKYVFQGRSDGKDLLNYYYIFIEDDGVFDEKYQPKNSGNYIGGEGGTWKKDGNQLIFKYKSGSVRNYKMESGNRLVWQMDDGVVFTFKKE